MKNHIAHKNNETGQTQSLFKHLKGTAEFAREQGEKIKFGNACYLLGLIHDIGKSSDDFQNMIINETDDKVDHSSAGAYYIEILSDSFCWKNGMPENAALYKNFKEILQYVVEAHHGVFDSIGKNEQNSKFSRILSRIDKFKNSEHKATDDFFEELNNIYDLSDIYINAYIEFENSISGLGVDVNTDIFRAYRFFYVRLFLSVLKASDVFDTINSTEKLVFREKITDELKDSFIEKIEKKAGSFGTPKREIDKVRKEISDSSCICGKKAETGIYRLNVPTGGGKTISSMRYSCHHAKNANKDRIIYITSFLSVLEQNAGEIKDIFGSENERYILEHHSNIIEEGSFRKNECVFYNKEKIQEDYLMESWDDFIVLSTTVQFFNTLMKVKSANLRRFSSLINSVIVIDEVQALPIKVTYIFNVAMNFLKNVMNTTVVLCTATQPLYDLDDFKYKLEYGDKKGENTDIVVLSDEQREIFRRVKCKKMFEEKEYGEISDIVDDVESNRDKSNLVILNTKKAVRDVYSALKGEEDDSIYYLSTNLCPIHRKKKIKEIKKRLGEGEKIICISTQLIEAGVDVDFNRVIRSYAGVDSIVQSAGRCNREGKISEGEMLVVDLDNNVEKTSSIKEIDEKKHITEEILFQKSGEINIDELSDEFFRRYYINHNVQMEYLLGKDEKCLIDKIAKGTAVNRRRVKADYVINQQFKEIAKDFNLIDENTKGVIVPYGKGKVILENLIEKISRFEDNYDFSLLPEIRALIRELQPYTINMYPDSRPMDNCMVYLDNIDMPVYILADGYYNEEYGVVEDLENMCSVL